MKDGLVTRLRFTKIREYELAWVDAAILEAEESGLAPSKLEKEEKMEQDEPVTKNGAASLASDTLAVLAAPSSIVPDHSTVFVNEPKLSDVS